MNLSDIPSDHINILISKSLLNNYCTKFNKKFKKFKNTGNPEAVHQLRVYSRRLIEVLDFFSIVLPPQKIKTWKNEIKMFLTSLNQPRDIHVQIDYIEHLQEKTNKCANISLRIVRLLRKQEAKQEKRISNSFTRILKNNVLKDISKFCKNENVLPYEQLSPSNHKIFGSHCKFRLKPLLKRLNRYWDQLPDPSRVSELHRCRLLMKKIRYTLEILYPIYHPLEEQLNIAIELQSILGEIHDCDVWFDFLNGYLEELTNEKIKHSKAEYIKLKRELKYLMTIRQSEREAKHGQLIDILEKYDQKAFEKQLLKVF